jgi:hypothetical protein
VVLTALPLLAVLAVAQARASNAGPPPTPVSPSEPLLGYRGLEVAIRYSPGALDRAVHVSKRLDLVVAELEKPLHLALPITAMVLRREDWERRGLTRAYGLPQPLSVGTIAVPAEGDRATVRRWKTWLGTDLPDLGGVPIIGTAEDASSLMLADIVLQVEICELILDRTPAAAAEPWIRGLLSHLAALSLWTRFEPSRRPEIEMVWTRLRGTIPPLLTLEARRLEAGDPPLAVERWLLGEAHLFEGAVRAEAAGGEKAFQKLLKSMTRERKPPTRAQLFELYPPLEAWLRALPAEAGILSAEAPAAAGATSTATRPPKRP